MKIIPAIDILNGKCVRLSKGDYNRQTVYHEDPLEVALEMESFGIQYLHVVDLDGARSKHIINHGVLKKLATKTKLQIDFGGGIKSNEDVQLAFDCGAAQITLGSIAVGQPEMVTDCLAKYGADCIILGADCKNRNIATHGWLEQSALDVIKFLKVYAAKGITNVICTDIEMDGMLKGPSLKLYKDILNTVNINLIASGGVATIADLEALKEAGCAGAIIGKAIYENRISLKEISKLC